MSLRTSCALAAVATMLACSASDRVASVHRRAATVAAPISAEQAARETVVALFDAFAAGDCDAIEALVGDDLRAKVQAESCADFLRDEPLRTVEVTHIGLGQVDGRDPDSLFVRVSLVEAGHERPILVFVQQHPDGNRVVSI